MKNKQKQQKRRTDQHLFGFREDFYHCKSISRKYEEWLVNPLFGSKESQVRSRIFEKNRLGLFRARRIYFFFLTVYIYIDLIIPETQRSIDVVCSSPALRTLLHKHETPDAPHNVIVQASLYDDDDDRHTSIG